MIGKPQFTLRTAMIATTLIAWLVCVFLPGGYWVTLPVGFALLALASLLTGLRMLSHTSKAIRLCAWGQSGLSLLALATFIVIYPTFWPVALHHRNSAISTSELRDYVYNKMDAQLVCDDGRRLLRYMEDSSISSLSSFTDTYDEVPRTIACLRPVYIDVYDGKLIVPVDIGDNRFYIWIFADGKQGHGHQRLVNGLWIFNDGVGPCITDAEWNAGVRR
jgi:hypothetical protein